MKKRKEKERKRNRKGSKEERKEANKNIANHFIQSNHPRTNCHFNLPESVCDSTSLPFCEEGWVWEHLHCDGLGRRISQHNAGSFNKELIHPEVGRLFPNFNSVGITVHLEEREGKRRRKKQGEEKERRKKRRQEEERKI